MIRLAFILSLIAAPVLADRDDHDLAANFPDDDYDLAGGTHPRGDC